MTWAPRELIIGETITFADGYTYRVTEHGPLIEGKCVDCGGRAYEAQGYVGPTKTRCSTCGRKHYGLPPF
jgi:hypothetical protein